MYYNENICLKVFSFLIHDVYQAASVSKPLLSHISATLLQLIYIYIRLYLVFSYICLFIYHLLLFHQLYSFLRSGAEGKREKGRESEREREWQGNKLEISARRERQISGSGWVTRIQLQNVMLFIASLYQESPPM